MHDNINTYIPIHPRGDIISIEAHCDATGRLTINGDVKEDGGGELSVGGAGRCVTFTILLGSYTRGRGEGQGQGVSGSQQEEEARSSTRKAEGRGGGRRRRRLELEL